MPGTDRRNSSSSSEDANSLPPSRQMSQDGSELIPTRGCKVSAPKPASNPLQFIKVGPCDLYKAAQEQIKKVEEIKKVEKVKDESEDWQSNLDNWKCSRRKRQEHIIERVVEVKKMELEEHDRNRKRSKTFNEMMEERTSKGGLRKMSLLAYPDDDANDLSDLGLASSNKEDNHDNSGSNGLDNRQYHEGNGNNESRTSEYGSSTSATTSSPEPEEYTYERAIQGYMNFAETKIKTPVKNINERQTNGNARFSPPKKETGSKIGAKLSELEQIRRRSESSIDVTEKQLPKVDINKRRSMFENSEVTDNSLKSVERVVKDLSSTKSIKERMENLEKTSVVIVKAKPPSEPIVTAVKQRLCEIERPKSIESLATHRLSNGDLMPGVSIKERLTSLEKQGDGTERSTRAADVALNVSIKERVSHLDSACNKEPNNKLTPDRDITFREKLETFKEKTHEENVNNWDCSEEYERKNFHRSLDCLDKEVASERKDSFERVQSMEELERSENEPPLFVSQSSLVIQQVPSDAEPVEVSGQVVKDSTVEGSLVEGNTVESSMVEGNVIEGGIVDSNIVEDSSVGGVMTDGAEGSTTNITNTPHLSSGIMSSDNHQTAETETETDQPEPNNKENVKTEKIQALDKEVPKEDDETEFDDEEEEEEEEEISSLSITFENHRPRSKKLLLKQPVGRVRKLTPILTPPIQLLSPTCNLQIIEEGDTPPAVGQLMAGFEESIERSGVGGTKDMEDGLSLEAQDEESLYTDEALDEALAKVDDDDDNDEGEMVTRFDVHEEIEKKDKCPPAPVVDVSAVPPNYENVIITNEVAQLTCDTQLTELSFTLNSTAVQPPKEKPPPPPVDMSDDETSPELPPKPSLRRLDSTKRIKKEIRKKRSDFLGIENGADDSYLEPEVYVSPPPDMLSFLQEERRLEQQLYRQSICSESDSNHETAESRDSGVELDRGHVDDVCWSKQPLSPDVLSEPHSRQNSETFGNTSITSEEDEIMKKEREIIEVLEKEEQWRYGNNSNCAEENDIGEKLAVKLRQLEQEKKQLEWERAEGEGRRQAEEAARREEEQRLKAREQTVREQENSANSNPDTSRAQESLRNERERLAKEQLELEKCRQTMLKQQQQRQSSESLDMHRGAAWDTPSTRHSLQDARHVSQQPMCSTYRFSLPDLQQRPAPPMPPSKPRPLSYDRWNGRVPSVDNLQALESKPRQVSQEEWSGARVPSVDSLPSLEGSPAKLRHGSSVPHVSHGPGTQQMTRSTLHALSAAPRSRLITNENWMQPKRKADAPKGNYNYQHWLIQEAEHRRIIEQQQREGQANRRSLPAHPSHSHSASAPSHHTVGLPSPQPHKWFTPQPQQRQEKPLPDSIIQTLTQRVQKRASSLDGKSTPRRRLDVGKPPTTNGHDVYPAQGETQERMLSVSGKKKCSHCDQELGRGAAMIIESLRLFYHIDCFKCCVCHIQLGDGLIGTDVRVRNNKLHCHNCYSSDDGVKFSCV